MEDSFGINMLSLVDGQPQTLGLKQMIHYFVLHREEVIRNSTQYDLNIAKNRQHILEGLKIALDYIDEIVALIRSHKNRETARLALEEQYGLSEIQANAILDMRMVQLTGLEQEKIENEYQEILIKIADLENILATPERVMDQIKYDLDDINKQYGDPRRTEICVMDADMNEEDFIEDHEMVITLSHKGYVKRQPLDTYRAQKRGGKGISSISTRAEDFANDIVVTSVLAHMLFFTNQGRVFSYRAYQIPESSRQAKGWALVNFLELRPEEKVTTLIAARKFDDERSLLMVTKRGIVKKTALSAFTNIRKSGLIAVNLLPEDELVGVLRVENDDKILITTSRGFSISFEQKQIRAMGRTATGIRGIRLGNNDYVVGADKYREQASALLVTEHGYGKRVDLSEFKLQNRGGKGLKSIDITNKNGALVACKIVHKDDELVMLTGDGQLIRLETDEISLQKRYSRGVLLMKLPKDDRIVGIARFKIEKEE
jgi:DNA gyrase subunit A